MATSGTAVFKLDVDGLVAEAIDRIGGEISTGYEAKTARRSLNILFSDLANRGINLWTVDEQTFTCTAGTATYTLPADTVDTMQVWVRRSGTDVEVKRWSRAEWTRLPNKSLQGRPVNYWLDRTIGAPVMTLWPVPENSTDTIRYTRQRRIQDALAMGNDVDFPFRYYPALVSGLAWLLGEKRPQNIDMNRRMELKARFEEDLMRAQEEDREKVSLFISPWRR